jgi:hypothetical protein
LRLLRDARLFILSHRRAIEIAPLQVYASALVFSPTRSLIRELFEKEVPNWITLKPSVKTDWNVCLQTLKVGRMIAHLLFDPMTSSRFSTDTGLLNLDLPAPALIICQLNQINQIIEFFLSIKSIHAFRKLK